MKKHWLTFSAAVILALMASTWWLSGDDGYAAPAPYQQYHGAPGTIVGSDPVIGA